jgi:(p)ppGpp synthase/HD superfamily hydrolase
MGTTVGEPRYSERLDRALALAADAFRRKTRKGTGIPYLTHLLQVMVTVGEHGGTEDQMIAAVLHDYLEDIEDASEDELRRDFGDTVAEIVVALSDATTHPKPPWQERKEAYIALVRTKPAEVKLVSAADKLHNAQSLVRDYATVGEDLWNRFTATRDQTLWYYREMIEALGTDWEHPLLDELRRVVAELHRAAGASG